MNKIHEKSPCCRGSVWRLGERRRRCSICKKTWRVWQKKRGRKRDRLDMNSLFKYFKGNLKNTRLEKKTLSAHLRILLKKFNQETPWPPIPDGPIILIADGLIQFFGKENIQFISS